jgi:hypothetical protein
MPISDRACRLVNELSPGPRPAVDEAVTPSGRGAPYQIAASRKGEDTYDSEVLGTRDKKSQFRTKLVSTVPPQLLSLSNHHARVRD